MKETSELPLFNTIQNTQPEILSVTQLSQQIRTILEPAFERVTVKGEISNFRPAASGHVYFSLKDESSVLSAALFGWGKRQQSIRLKEGMEVICRGKISVYPPRGSYQLIVDSVEPVGHGALQIAFQKLKDKLNTEGLFAPESKQQLPKYPATVCVITSATGAAVQDMLNVFSRLAPHIKVYILSVLVQGDQASLQIKQALEYANQKNLADIVVLARGGGSIEDLWCFNDEGLARAIFNSKLPVVSAVGHEIDFTIADFVADVRSPTPSAAAEIISRHWVGIVNEIKLAQERLCILMSRELASKKELLSHIRARIISPKDRLREQSQRCDDAALRLHRAILYLIESKDNQVARLSTSLSALSPLKVLERGYSIVQAQRSNHLIKSSKHVLIGDKLTIRFHDGESKVQAVS